MVNIEVARVDMINGSGKTGGNGGDSRDGNGDSGGDGRNSS